MLNLFWIFEHITGGALIGLLSVNFAHAKSSPETFGHLYSDFLVISVYQGVKICNLKWFCFWFLIWSIGFRVMTARVILTLDGWWIKHPIKP